MGNERLITDAVVKALKFYRDGFQLHPKRGPTGINHSEWKATPELLEDCGNMALAALSALTQSAPQAAGEMETPPPSADLAAGHDLRRSLGDLLVTIQPLRKWINASLSFDERIALHDAIEAARSAWSVNPAHQPNMPVGKS